MRSEPLAGTTPVIALIAVDLPLPLEPMSPRISCSWSVIDTRSTARTPPKLTEISRPSITGCR